MKINITNEIEVENIKLKFSQITFPIKEIKLAAIWTCQQCGGHGCNNHVQRNDECNQGSVFKNIKIENFEKTFGKQNKEDLKILLDLINKLENNK